MSFERTDSSGKTHRAGDELRPTCLACAGVQLENTELHEKNKSLQHELFLRQSRIDAQDKTIRSLREALAHNYEPKHD